MNNYNKAIVAFIMAAINFIETYYQIDLGLDETTVSILFGVLSTLLVYAVPNGVPMKDWLKKE